MSFPLDRENAFLFPTKFRKVSKSRHIDVYNWIPARLVHLRLSEITAKNHDRTKLPLGNVQDLGFTTYERLGSYNLMIS